jgi:hypothetical protein
MTHVVNGGQQPQSNDDDHYTLRRYGDFRAAAGYVADAFALVPAVRRVALGSIASAPRIESGRRRRGYLHEPKDVDLAVWLDNVADLDSLRKLSARALNLGRLTKRLGELVPGEFWYAARQAESDE